MDTKFHASVGLFGGGGAGGGLVPQILRYTDRLGTTKSVFVGWAVDDFNRNIAPLTTPGYGTDAPHLSVSLKELGLTDGNRGSEEVSRSNEDITRPALGRQASRFHEAFRANGIRDGLLFEVGGMPSGHLWEREFFLNRLHSRLERLSTLHLAVVADDAAKRQRLEAAWRVYKRMYEQGVSRGGFLVDNRSPKVRSSSLAVQDDQIALATAALLSIQRFNRRHPSIVEIAQTLTRSAMFAGVSIAVQDLDPGKPPPHWDLLRQLAPRVAAKGSGDLDDIVDACCQAAEMVTNDRRSYCLDELPDPADFLIFVFCIPLRRRDRRWPTIASRVRSWLLDHFDKPTALFVAANGAEDPRCQSEYRVQATLLYSLPRVPTALRELLPGEAAEVDERADVAVNDHEPEAHLPPLVGANLADEDWE
jgi:hypothetical protein